MALTRLLIQNFRNIESADLDLAADFNFIIGENGSGKTSLLEAIYTLGHGRAFRTIHNDKVIRQGQNDFVLHGRLQHENQSPQSLGLQKSLTGETDVRIDGDDGHKIAELAHLMPIQLITPEGFTLLNGGPKYRRAFLDWGCFHHYPAFFRVWSNVKRLVRQRNAALRQVSSYQQIKPWDMELAPQAEQLSQWRADYAEAITENIYRTCEDFLPEYQLSLSFYRGWDKETSYSEVLVNQFERDKQLTYTSLGAHKADLRIRVNHSAVEDILSRGQLKLLMCALRLAQGEYYTAHKKRQCLYLIDDFASELDDKRRQLLAQRLKATGAQVFVSAINAEHIGDMIDENNKMFFVKCGKITTCNK